jgi:phosphatidylglycerophosphate synthase
MPGTFTHATRELTGFTARREKELLVWIARRLPRSVNADHLTLLAALAMPGAAAAYAWARTWPPALHFVNLCLLLNWLGDSLDGTLARVRGEERPRYGFYVDHVLDCAGAVVLVMGMAASDLMTWYLALPLLVAYLLVCVEVYLATYCLATFRMSFLGVGPTELRLLLAVGNLAALQHPFVTLAGQAWKLFDLGALVAIAALLVVFVTSATRNGKALFDAEPRRR